MSSGLPGVEIAGIVGQPSASEALASETAHEAARLNARGVRIARIFDAKGRKFECGASADQVAALMAAGAIEK